ncbi:YgaP family membrane protein [Gordonia iterans]
MPLSRYENTALTVDRLVPALASVMLFVSIALVAALGPWWLFLTGFVALNLAFYAYAGWCPASLIMEKLGLGRDVVCRR